MQPSANLESEPETPLLKSKNSKMIVNLTTNIMGNHHFEKGVFQSPQVYHKYSHVNTVLQINYFIRIPIWLFSIVQVITFLFNLIIYWNIADINK